LYWDQLFVAIDAAARASSAMSAIVERRTIICCLSPAYLHMPEIETDERIAAARSRAAADAKTKADAIAKKKAESAAAAKIKAERKVYAAREAAENAEKHARALVVDTSIGWNPDSIIAVWALCMHTLRSRTRVLIVSSDEIYPQNPRHQLIQRVIDAVSEDVRDLGWDQVRLVQGTTCRCPRSCPFRLQPRFSFRILYGGALLTSALLLACLVPILGNSAAVSIASKQCILQRQKLRPLPAFPFKYATLCFE
jgi:hypothetical protein